MTYSELWISPGLRHQDHLSRGVDVAPGGWGCRTYIRSRVTSVLWPS